MGAPYLVDELLYRAYATQRDLGVTPEQWSQVVATPNLVEYEERYQREAER